MDMRIFTMFSITVTVFAQMKFRTHGFTPEQYWKSAWPPENPGFIVDVWALPQLKFDLAPARVRTVPAL